MGDHMKYPLADYSSCCMNIAALDSNETHHHSFLLTKEQKQIIGYRAKFLQYQAHFTNKRLILENKPVSKWIAPVINSLMLFSDNASFDLQTKLNMFLDRQDAKKEAEKYYSIPYEEILKFELIHILKLPRYVKIVFKKIPHELSQEFVFTPHKAKNGALELTYRASDFAEIGNKMLQNINR